MTSRLPGMFITWLQLMFFVLCVVVGVAVLRAGHIWTASIGNWACGLYWFALSTLFIAFVAEAVS